MREVNDASHATGHVTGMGKPVGLLRVKKVSELLGVSIGTVWGLSRNDPTFPKPVKITSNCTGWKASEVFDWIESRERIALCGGAND